MKHVIHFGKSLVSLIDDGKAPIAPRQKAH